MAAARLGMWALGRLLAAGLLAGAAWLVYDFASSTKFQVQSVHVRATFC
jgi:hypothetical protein